LWSLNCTVAAAAGSVKRCGYGSHGAAALRDLCRRLPVPRTRMGAGGGLVRDVLRRSGCYLRRGSNPQIAIVGLFPVRKPRRRHCLRGLFIAHFIALAAGRSVQVIDNLVGVAGFEHATPSSRRCAASFSIPAGGRSDHRPLLLDRSLSTRGDSLGSFAARWQGVMLPGEQIRDGRCS
jgi:hypothetical protein